MKKKIFTGILLLVLAVAGWFAWKIFGPSVHPPKDQSYFYIRTGETTSDVADHLVAEKIITDRAWFKRISGWLGYKTARPGRYEIKKGQAFINLLACCAPGISPP